MRSYVLHFALLLLASLSVLFVLHALFEPSGGPRIAASNPPENPSPAEADSDVKDYFHPHYNEDNVLVWTIRGEKASGLTGRSMRFRGTELTLVQYGRDMQEVRRVAVSAPEASGEWDREGSGSIMFGGDVAVKTTDGLCLRTSLLDVRFRKSEARPEGGDPFKGWNWEFRTDRDVEITGPGIKLDGTGLAGTRDEMRMTIERNPSASIGRGLSEISELRKVGAPEGNILIRAGGPLVLTSREPDKESAGTKIKVRFENRVLLADQVPDESRPGGFRTESVLSCRMLETDLEVAGSDAGGRERKLSLVSVHGEGGVRYVNLGDAGLVEAAFSGNSVSFERPAEAGNAKFRISGVPRAVFLSSSSISSGFAAASEIFAPPSKQSGVENLLWIASDNELCAEAGRHAGGRGVETASVSIPAGATLASYARSAPAPAEAWGRDLSGSGMAGEIPSPDSLRIGFRPELVLTSSSADLKLRRALKREESRGGYSVESFMARGSARVLDYGLSGAVESFCEADTVSYSETPAAGESGADLRREVLLRGSPRLGFIKEFSIVPWSNSSWSVDAAEAGPSTFMLACSGEMYNIAFLKSRAGGGRVLRQIVNLAGDAVVQGFAPGPEAKAEEFFASDLKPAAGYMQQLRVRADSAELAFVPRGTGPKDKPLLDSVKAGGGVRIEAFDAGGSIVRSAEGETLDWSFRTTPEGVPSESGKLEGGRVKLGFTTAQNPLPFRESGDGGEDWVEVSTPGPVRFSRIPSDAKAGRAGRTEVSAPSDAEVTVRPARDPAGKPEWKLRAESLSLSTVESAAKGGKQAWTPVSFKASGGVTFYNYNAGGSVEAWGRGRTLDWTRKTAAGRAGADDWVLALEGAPMVQFPADGSFILGGVAHTPSEGEAPRDAWIRLESAKSMELSAGAFGTASEVLSLKATGGAVLTASGTLKGEEGKSYLRMEAPEIRCDAAAQGGREAGGKPRRGVREAAGSGETVITLVRPDGASGVYRGSDLSFNPMAADGEKRVWGPGKWTFELKRE